MGCHLVYWGLSGVLESLKKRGLERKWGEVPRQECVPDQGLWPGQQEGLQHSPWENLEAAQDGRLLAGHGWTAGGGRGLLGLCRHPPWRAGGGGCTYSALTAFLFSYWVANVFPVFLLL